MLTNKVTRIERNIPKPIAGASEKPHVLLSHFLLALAAVVNYSTMCQVRLTASSRVLDSRTRQGLAKTAKIKQQQQQASSSSSRQAAAAVVVKQQQRFSNSKSSEKATAKALGKQQQKHWESNID